MYAGGAVAAGHAVGEGLRAADGREVLDDVVGVFLDDLGDRLSDLCSLVQKNTRNMTNREPLRISKSELTLEGNTGRIE